MCRRHNFTLRHVNVIVLLQITQQTHTLTQCWLNVGPTLNTSIVRVRWTRECFTLVKLSGVNPFSFSFHEAIFFMQIQSGIKVNVAAFWKLTCLFQVISIKYVSLCGSNIIIILDAKAQNITKQQWSSDNDTVGALTVINKVGLI